MKKHYNVEFLRFLFSVIIVYFHITHSNIMPYVGDNPFYLLLQKSSVLSSALVECFLIISGYFMFLSWKKSPDKPFFEFAINRFFRLWPVFAFYTVCTVLLGGRITEDTLLDLAFLRCTGISLSYKGIIWYIAPFFWSSLLMYAILKTCKIQTAGLLIAVIAYFGYAINLNYTGGGLSRQVIWDFLSLGMLRTMAGIGAGILVGMAISAFNELYEVVSTPRGHIRTAVVSAVEFFCFALLILVILTTKAHVKNVFCIVILFSVLFICFISNAGILSRCLNHPIFGLLGKYSYSIYVMQQVSFNILANTLWQHANFLQQHEIITVLVSLAFSVFIGIATYYLIEQPAFTLFKKWEKKHRLSSAVK